MSEPIGPDQDGRFQQACLALTRSQVKAIVETYLSVEERRSKLSAAVSRETGTAPGAVSIIQHLTDELCPTLASLRRTCHAYSDISGACRWVDELPPLGPVMAAGLGAAFVGTQLRDADHLHRLCGLHPAAQIITPAEGARYFQRFYRDVLSVLPDELKSLAAATGRALRHEWNATERIPRADVVEWLSRPVCSEFVERLMRRAGQAFAKQKGTFDNRFSRAYQMRLAHERRLNDSECYAVRAQQELRRAAGRNSMDLETYRHRRLPLWQLEEMAKRWVLRQFLTEFHQRLQTSGSLGILPPEEPY